MAKIQVQGIGVYDDKTLKKKIIDMANSLSKLAKKGEWSKSSENGIRALGRMWGAYQDWSRQNESINEAVYKFKGMTASNMDELDADLSRENVKGTPDFNKMTYTIHKPKKDVYIDYYIKTKYKKFKPKRIKESVQINERMKTPFMVHPTDPDQTERHFVKLFKLLSKGHPHPIDYGPRESDQYEWNDRRNYTKSIEEYNKYMNRIADKLNKSLDEMNNIYKVWSKIRDKYRKIDKS